MTDRRRGKGLARLAAQPRAALGVVALALAAWAFLAWLMLDMDHPFARLTMPGSWRWTPAHAGAILAMWAVMMAAMISSNSPSRQGARTETSDPDLRFRDGSGGAELSLEN